MPCVQLVKYTNWRARIFVTAVTKVHHWMQYWTTSVCSFTFSFKIVVQFRINFWGYGSFRRLAGFVGWVCQSIARPVYVQRIYKHRRNTDVTSVSVSVGLTTTVFKFARALMTLHCEVRRIFILKSSFRVSWVARSFGIFQLKLFYASLFLSFVLRVLPKLLIIQRNNIA